MKLNTAERQALANIQVTPEEGADSQVINATLTFDLLYQHISDNQRAIIEKLRTLDPKEFGFKGARLGYEEVPRELHVIKNQSYTRDGKKVVIKDQYLPSHIGSVFERMQATYQQENPGKKLLVESAYRSPAYQMLVLIYYLRMYKFDFDVTLKQVAMPEYSQHCSADATAIDVINGDGIPAEDAPQDFYLTHEYQWLIKNAATFGFQESYPKNNPSGIMWEPWHWQYLPNKV